MYCTYVLTGCAEPATHRVVNTNGTVTHYCAEHFNACADHYAGDSVAELVELLKPMGTL